MCDPVSADITLPDRNTKRAALFEKVKSLLRERSELDCQLLSAAADTHQSTREKRVELSQQIKLCRRLLRSRRSVRRRPILTDAEKKERRKVWNSRYYSQLQAKARAFMELSDPDRKIGQIDEPNNGAAESCPSA